MTNDFWLHQPTCNKIHTLSWLQDFNDSTKRSPNLMTTLFKSANDTKILCTTFLNDKWFQRHKLSIANDTSDKKFSSGHFISSFFLNVVFVWCILLRSMFFFRANYVYDNNSGTCGKLFLLEFCRSSVLFNCLTNFLFVFLRSFLQIRRIDFTMRSDFMRCYVLRWLQDCTKWILLFDFDLGFTWRVVFVTLAACELFCSILNPLGSFHGLYFNSSNRIHRLWRTE